MAQLKLKTISDEDTIRRRRKSQYKGRILDHISEQIKKD
jgi:transposase